MEDILAKFEELSELKEKVSSVSQSQLEALNLFHPSAKLTAIKKNKVDVFSFLQLYNPSPTIPTKVSIASTATCIKSLQFCPEFQPRDNADYTKIVDNLGERLKANNLNTSGLHHGNPFTIGLLLPILRAININKSEPIVIACIDFAINSIKEAEVEPNEGGISLKDYPPNAYLTYWILNGLSVWEEDISQFKRTLEWSRTEFYRQISLFTSNADEYSDAFQLGYNLLIQYKFDRGNLKSPVIELGLKTLFDAQLKRGIWEKKDPLFVYGESGDAYCFSFELLTALFIEFLKNNDTDFFAAHEKNFISAFEWTIRNKHYIGDNLLPVWRSGHRVNNQQAESWATAEVYLFLQLYKTYLTRKIQKLLLNHFNVRPSSKPKHDAFADFFLPTIKFLKKDESLDHEKKLDELLISKVLEPLKKSANSYSLVNNIERKERIRSGILFGPPGTGKTAFVNAMANYLGWSIITLDPSDFAKDGMHLIPNTTSKIFRFLMELEDTVIFFDEMEELIKERTDGTGFEQKFLTTSFLPKLQNLANKANCLFFVATNFYTSIDRAAKREGRFDFQIQIVPPSFDEKMRMLDKHIPSIKSEIKDYFPKIRDNIEWATLSEMKRLIDNLKFMLGKAKDTETIDFLRDFEAKLNDTSDKLVKDYHDDIKYNQFNK